MARLYYVLSGLEGSDVNQDDFESPIEGFTPESDPQTGVITLDIQTRVNDDGDGVQSEQVLATFYEDSSKTTPVATATVTILENFGQTKVATVTANPPTVQEGSSSVATINGVNNVNPGDVVYYSLTGQGITQEDTSTPLQGEVTIGSDGNGILVINTLVNDDTPSPDVENMIISVFGDSARSQNLSNTILSIRENVEECTATPREPSIDEGEQGVVDFTLVSSNNTRDRVYYRLSGENVNQNDFSTPVEGELFIQEDGTENGNTFIGTLVFNTLVNEDNTGAIIENVLVQFFLEETRDEVCSETTVTVREQAPNVQRALIFDNNNVEEGESINATFISQNSENGEQVFYTIRTSTEGNGGEITQEDIAQPLQGVLTIQDGQAEFRIDTLVNTDDNEPLSENAIMEVFQESTRETLLASNSFTITEENVSGSTINANFNPTSVVEGDSSTLIIEGVSTQPGDRIFFTIFGEGIDENDFVFDDSSSNVTKEDNFNGSVILDGNNSARVLFSTFENEDDSDNPSEVLNVNFFLSEARNTEDFVDTTSLTIFEDTRTEVQQYSAFSNQPVVQEGDSVTFTIIETSQETPNPPTP